MNNRQAIDRLLKHMEWGWTEETAKAIELGIQALKEKDLCKIQDEKRER